MRKAKGNEGNARHQEHRVNPHVGCKGDRVRLKFSIRVNEAMEVGGLFTVACLARRGHQGSILSNVLSYLRNFASAPQSNFLRKALEQSFVRGNAGAPQSANYYKKPLLSPHVFSIRVADPRQASRCTGGVLLSANAMFANHVSAHGLETPKGFTCCKRCAFPGC